MTRVVGGVFRGAVVAWGVEQPGSRTDHQHDAGDRHPCIEADGFELGRADFLRAGAQQHHLPHWRRFAEMRPIRH